MLLTALLFNTLTGVVCASVLGFSPVAGAVGMNAVAAFMGMAPQSASILREGVYTEIWTGELVKVLRAGLEGTWLSGIPDQSSIVNNDVIHLVEVGVDPDVLINNKTYPIDVQALEDKDIAIKLDKFQTKATPITDDELYAISYDKTARVKEGHANSINDAKFTKAAHALCANKNTATTPVLKTTGEKDPATNRLRLTVNDLVEMKRALDNLRVPSDGRRLVLCPDHVNDLLLTSQAFREQYNIDRNSGKVGNLYGFEIYEYGNNPLYTTAGVKKALATTAEAGEIPCNLYGFEIYEYGNNPLYTTAGVKKALGATAEAGEFPCSFAFYKQRVFKATGSTKMYYSESKNDPLNQRNLINFRHYFICMPKKEDAGVVMMSGYQA